MVAVVCASGPSLTAEDVDSVRGRVGCVIVVNATFRIAPWADHLYACDRLWWDSYVGEVRRVFAGDCWTMSDEAARRYGLRHLRNQGRNGGLNPRPGVIYHGGNSGYQAIGLAHDLGHRRIILLGFDCQAPGGRKHHHADHPGKLNRPLAFAKWAERFAVLAEDAPNHGVEIINCTRETALTCYPRMTLSDALK